jgi:hypothetical protein
MDDREDTEFKDNEEPTWKGQIGILCEMEKLPSFVATSTGSDTWK